MTATAAQDSLLSTARAWLAKDPDASTKAQLQHAIDNNDTDALQSAFGERISFGTAGLRAAMGFGPARMNRLVIIETTAGLAQHLLATNPDAKKQGVVIAYDGRHGSKDFAQSATGVLVAAGIKTYLFSETTPTPLGAFATRTFGAAAGIVVTASHNPPQDNGYKVYWHGGAQINSPLDSQIAAAIDKVAESSELPSIDQASSNSSLLTLLDRSLFESYAKETLATFPPPGEADTSTLKAHAELGIAYTPMHGVGAPFAEELFKRSGFTSVQTVKEQRQPDGDFPTVKFPNPEEPGAMDLVIALADSMSPPATIAIANDPDADRLSACARLSQDGKTVMKQLTGDQVGAILGDELMRRFNKAQQQQREEGWVLTTIVSSRLLARLAKSYNVNIRECLTGFKWLGTVARAIEGSGTGSDRFLFAYEEALGYMVQPNVWDKDGLSALVLLSSIAAELNAQSPPLTLWDRLQEIHKRAGLSVTFQRTIRLAPGKMGSSVMTKLRAALKEDSEGLPLKFALVDDLLDRPAASGRAEDLDRIVKEGIIPRNDVLRFYVAGAQDGTDRSEIELSAPRIIVRPSGTEPKVKIYCEALGSVHDSEGESYRDAEARIRKELENIVDTFYSWITAL
ncbi:hypothetical protein A4X09_0g5733 [Tilletia walkeri]|uniref:Phosphomannomutase n=1 Tax=Tilletia walkeri TaxID=117179 RepID=A0A8X7N4X2_9BASI|nr:hypothetical protein A4X09_0g5733 [Tilletia walkeri]